MSPKAEQLLKEAMELPPDERVDIGSVLYNSGEADPDIDQSSADEIKRRIEEIESGKVQCVPWEQVRREVRQMIDDAKARHTSRGSR